MTILLEVRDLKTQFHTDAGLVKAVDGVSFHINKGEIVGLVGESGCGKSVSQLSVMQLIPSPPGKIAQGEVIFEGHDLLKYAANGPKMRAVRGAKIAMIFQEPMTSLNPVASINQQLNETMELHLGMSPSAARQRSVELLKMVGISDAETRIDDYPHQFSGGMRQRVMIAMGVSCNPKLLIADEPTTALDVTTQAVLLELMKDMVERFNAALVIVTHNLGVVARYAKRIYVMYAGRVVESGTTQEIFAHPCHPYTIGLIKCIPRLDEARCRKLVPIEGLPPNLVGMPPTCAFLPRCPYRVDQCYNEPWPPLTVVHEQHEVSCFVDMQGKANELLRSPALSISSVKALSSNENDVVLEAKNLKMYFPVTRGLMRKKVAYIKAVDDVSFKIRKGETMGLVGESGCGKTTTGRCVLRLYEPTSGTILFQGRDILRLPQEEIRKMRIKMSLIFQDPYGSLDPRQSAGSIVGEPLIVHRMVKSKGEYRDRVEELFRIVGLDPCLTERVPHEFSGGQRQRIGIARALACEPDLIICDEPISALDVSIQAQIINLLQQLKEGLKSLSYLFIAHDLSVVRHISDRVAVMYLGHIVEVTNADELYQNPLHPYTKALLSAVPIADPFVEEKRKRILLKGEVTSLLNPPAGCSFHQRCSMAIPECSITVPPLRDIGNNHEVACIRV